MNRVVNSSPYLRTTREFPYDQLYDLGMECNKSYLDIAHAVNERVIGIYPTLRPAISGATWFFDKALKQQGLRQVFTFTSTANIAHNIQTSTISSFSNCYGTYTDGTNWYGLIYGSSTAIAGQISFYLTPTNIVFAVGSSPPTLTKGILVLEWISQP